SGIGGVAADEFATREVSAGGDVLAYERLVGESEGVAIGGAAMGAANKVNVDGVVVAAISVTVFVTVLVAALVAVLVAGGLGSCFLVTRNTVMGVFFAENVIVGIHLHRTTIGYFGARPVLVVIRFHAQHLIAVILD
ncbi:MAG: hypothetical protein Q9198_006185, partial [Flavoplaca austrocitrina]